MDHPIYTDDEKVESGRKRQIAGLKKQAMAERADQLPAGKGWLPPLLTPA
ncbi:hypothetical protein [Bradyrhizobium sp. CCGUVB23]|nr:hypothetical protein [Bradyrhizobium sp. CCGUVB23]MCP3460655.1 hypothetical protein [Bradyrhizobium sp. CCGUVB23]